MPVTLPWPTNASVLVGDFHGHTTMVGWRATFWHKKGSANAATIRNGYQARQTAMVGRPISPATHGFSQAGSDKVPSAPSSDILVQTTLKLISF